MKLWTLAHVPKNIEALVQSTRVLVVDDDYYMRKVIKSLLQASGIKTFTKRRTVSKASKRSSR